MMSFILENCRCNIPGNSQKCEIQDFLWQKPCQEAAQVNFDSFSSWFRPGTQKAEKLHMVSFILEKWQSDISGFYRKDRIRDFLRLKPCQWAIPHNFDGFNTKSSPGVEEIKKFPLISSFSKVFPKKNSNLQPKSEKEGRFHILNSFFQSICVFFHFNIVFLNDYSVFLFKINFSVF